MVAVAGIFMLVAARIAFQSHEVTYFVFDRGILFPSSNLWITDHWLTMAVNTALILITALGWLLLVQVFNPFRAMTTLGSSFFLVMMASVPEIADQLFSGTLLAAAMPVCLALLWSSFADLTRMRHIFLLFCILSALSTTQYCFLFYIPVFIIGCVQMKIFNLRTIIAIALGLITPWWIMLGLGLADLSDLHLPAITGFFTTFDAEGIVNLALVAGTTATLLITSWVANFMNVLTLNANLRAFNGSISLLSVFTILAGCADFTNAPCYLPTLMLLTSYQLSYTFGKSNNPHRFIPVLAIMAIYSAFYIIRIML